MTFTETATEALFNVFINGVSAGTVQATRPDGSGDFWSMSAGGDQMFIYQGTVASPTLIWGTDFDKDAPEGAWSGVPAGTGGTNSTRPASGDLALAFSPAYVNLNTLNDQYRYTGTTTGTKVELQTAIANPANWTTQETEFGSNTAVDPFPTLTFTVNAPGATPTLDTNTGSTVAEGGTDIISAAELETNDSDTADGSLTYTLDSTVANGTLFVDSDGSGTLNGGETGLGIGGTFTQANIANNRLVYTHNDGETTSDSFQFDVSDGTNGINNQTFNITVTPVNDPPSVTGFQGDTSNYNELFGGPVPIESSGDVVVSDIDDANFNGGSLTVSITGAIAKDQLSIANGGAVGIGIAGSGVFFNSAQIGTFAGGTNGTSLVVTFTTANATNAAVAALIQALRYNNSSADNPIAGNRLVNVVLNDGDNNSSTSTATVTVTAVEDDDTTTGDGNANFIDSDTGNDILQGLGGGDTLTGNGGNDTLDGGTEADAMDGGTGDDTYIVDDAGDTVTELANEGHDTVQSSVTHTLSANVEDLLLLGAGATDGAGNELDNRIEGNTAGNVLNGLAGDDTLLGREGDDTLNGGDDNDRLLGAAGEDTLTGGTGNDRLNGGADDDILDGGDGNDVLFGDTGAGTMSGGANNDIYLVDDAGDIVTENPGEGTDLISSTIDLTLPDNVEKLTLRGGAHIGTGNALDNTISGYTGADTLSGLDGADRLRGYGGDDTLLGGNGEDMLEGGAGKDELTGGADRDIFLFRDGELGADRATADMVFDFSKTDRDKIRLKEVDADSVTPGIQGFNWIGNAAFSNTVGELRYEFDSGKTYVEGDTDGDGLADFAIGFNALIDFTAANFSL